MKKAQVPIVMPRRVITRLLKQRKLFNDPENYRALWFGNILVFSSAQNIAWQALWNNFLAGNLPLPQEAIFKEHPVPTTLANVFKRHPAWGTIIVGNRRGMFWLHHRFLDSSARPSIRRPANTNRRIIQP